MTPHWFWHVPPDQIKFEKPLVGQSPIYLECLQSWHWNYDACDKRWSTKRCDAPYNCDSFVPDNKLNGAFVVVSVPIRL